MAGVTNASRNFFFIDLSAAYNSDFLGVISIATFMDE